MNLLETLIKIDDLGCKELVYDTCANRIGMELYARNKAGLDRLHRRVNRLLKPFVVQLTPLLRRVKGEPNASE